MNNPQQPASPVKAEVVMLDTIRYQELLDAENLLNDLINGGYADLNWYWSDKDKYDGL